jgi:peptide/nickel transport system substrate-binding protein
METVQTHPYVIQGVRRRTVLKAALATGVTLSTWSLPLSPALSGAEDGRPKRGGMLRVRGFDPPQFDPHLPGGGFRAQATLRFVYSTLVRYRLGPAVPPGTFTVEPDLAERWDTPNEMTYIFHLRQGVKWHNKPPLNGRELVAELERGLAIL